MLSNLQNLTEILSTVPLIFLIAKENLELHTAFSCYDVSVSFNLTVPEFVLVQARYLTDCPTFWIVLCVVMVRLTLCASGSIIYMGFWLFLYKTYLETLLIGPINSSVNFNLLVKVLLAGFST